MTQGTSHKVGLQPFDNRILNGGVRPSETIAIRSATTALDPKARSRPVPFRRRLDRPIGAGCRRLRRIVAHKPERARLSGAIRSALSRRSRLARFLMAG